MSLTIRTDCDLSLERFGLEPGGRAQQVMDNAVIRFCMPYVPADTGTLMRSVYTATKVGSGQIIYPGPYAHYMFYGEVYGPNIPVYEDDSGVPTRYYSRRGSKKSPTGRDLTYAQDINPLAGPFWSERMKADHMADIIAEVQSAITGQH